MPRKRRNEVNGAPKKPARYDDATPHWIRALVEEVEEIADAIPGERRWQTPKHVYLQFSEKDEVKERKRNAVIQRQRERRDSRR
ncbi:hypothetical protein [Planococcus halocryophilus]|uniref:hypothetical protein n=1 Tax=Planococcus halocryophilus TaxID=1215089 RepID=UPI001F0F4641|nr:hypothetical protein [Planococcus halocryophilus]MCH4828078.1 hypothetical protein [Planococcus halocryophilus]